MPVAGIDLGGTKLAAAAFSDAGEVLHREAVPLAGRQGTGVGALIAERLKFLSANSNVRQPAYACRACIAPLAELSGRRTFQAGTTIRFSMSCGLPRAPLTE